MSNNTIIDFSNHDWHKLFYDHQIASINKALINPTISEDEIKKFAIPAFSDDRISDAVFLLERKKTLPKYLTDENVSNKDYSLLKSPFNHLKEIKFELDNHNDVFYKYLSEDFIRQLHDLFSLDPYCLC